MTAPDAARLALYTRAARVAADGVIRSYSTSFGLATALLPDRCRDHVRAVYAMVRVADEIVDGVAAEAGLDADAQRAALDAYEAATYEAMATGFAADLVLHAFAATARACGITRDVVEPFFASMRMDLDPRSLTPAEQARYVYGSAEVVGLMCLPIYLDGHRVSDGEHAVLVRGARALGAAFQNVNFLRDLADDAGRLGRGYLPAVGEGNGAGAGAAHGGAPSAGGARAGRPDEPLDGPQDAPQDAPLDEAGKRAWVRRIRADLRTADEGLALLPADVRPAVRAARLLFGELTARIAATPVRELYRERVSVPTPVKLRLVARAVLADPAPLLDGGWHPWRA